MVIPYIIHVNNSGPPKCTNAKVPSNGPGPNVETTVTGPKYAIEPQKAALIAVGEKYLTVFLANLNTV